MIRKDKTALVDLARHLHTDRLIEIYRQMDRWSDLHDLIKRSYFFTGRGSRYGQEYNISESIKIGEYDISYESSWEESRSHVYASDRLYCSVHSSDRSVSMSFGDIKYIKTALSDMIYSRYFAGITYTIKDDSVMFSWDDPLHIKHTVDLGSMEIYPRYQYPRSDLESILILADLTGVPHREAA